jgi:multisubunit Na+/H+ antiporter MnhB subunit
MKTPEKHAGNRLPKIARCINTAMAVVLFILAMYHYTQPNAAWRSGTVESLCAILLLAAAYLVSPLVTAVINAGVAVVMVGFGIRHAVIGGGWVSGSIELLFAAILITIAVVIYKKRTN